MDRRFDEGLALFNKEEYFDAHEVWEDLWHEYRGVDRTFLQGLIHAAAGLYHLQCENRKGAASQIGKALQKLGFYAPTHWGIRIDALEQELGICEATIEAPLDGRSWPRIHGSSEPPST